MSTYKYLGGMLPSLPSSRFVNSVFIDPATNEYYISEEEDDRIIGFEKVKATKDIAPVNVEIYAREGDSYIYSFSTGNRELVYGDRDSIETKLLALLDTDQLNVHSKLLISSFLNLYGSTLKLIEASNEDFEKKGIIQRLEEDTAFKNSSFDNNPLPDIVGIIYERYVKYKSVSENIQIDDIAFIRDDVAYFNNNCIDVQKIINRNCLNSDLYNRFMSQVITICTQKHMINLQKLTINNEVYEFLLESEYVVLEQHSIEEHLSEKVKENKLSTNDSILDIGIQLDKEISRNDKHTDSTYNYSIQNEKALMTSFLKIISNDSI